MRLARRDSIRPCLRWANSWWSTAWLLLLVTLARLAYLAFLCPYTLAEDEAHYWEWSRRLDLSYYTKGPGIAWTIAGGTGLFGDTELGVRFFAPVASGVAALAVAGIAWQMTRDARAAFLAACAWLLVPMFQVIALAMTIDGPYAACWAIALFGAWNAMGRGRVWGWPVLGLALGAGVLYKYTALLLLPGLIAYPLLFAHRAKGPRHVVGMLVGVAVFAAAVLPIVLWNQREGWPTLRHLLGHLGLAGGDMPVTQGAGRWHYDPRWTLEFIGSQLGMIGPLLLLAAGAAVSAWKHRRQRPGRWRRESFCVIMSAPILLFYLGVSFIAEPEGNWALAGYIGLMPLAAWFTLRGLDDWKSRVLAWRELPKPRPKQGVLRKQPETWPQVLWSAAIVMGLVGGLALLRLDWVAKLPGLSRVVPVWRFMGADEMAAHAARLGEEVRRETGQDPFYMCAQYGRAGQFAFYMPGHPVVFAAQSAVGGRVTQYDYWADTRLNGREELQGRPAVVVGVTAEQWLRAFSRVEEIGTLRGDGKRNRPAFKAYEFRGFDKKTVVGGGS